MFVLKQFNKFKCTPEALVVHDNAQINLLKTIIGGVGKNGPVQSEFFSPIRVMPDFGARSLRGLQRPALSMSNRQSLLAG